MYLIVRIESFFYTFYLNFNFTLPYYVVYILFCYTEDYISVGAVLFRILCNKKKRIKLIQFPFSEEKNEIKMFSNLFNAICKKAINKTKTRDNFIELNIERTVE